MPAGVVLDGAGGGKREDGDADLSGCVLLVLVGSHGFPSLFTVYFTCGLEINRFFPRACGRDDRGGKLPLTFPIIA
jgi:hypothetical protein